MGFDDEFDQLEFRDGRLVHREEDSDAPEPMDSESITPNGETGFALEIKLESSKQKLMKYSSSTYSTIYT